MFTFPNVPVAGTFHLVVPIIAVPHPLFGSVTVAVAVLSARLVPIRLSAARRSVRVRW